MYHLGFGDSLGYHDSVGDGDRSLCDHRFGFDGFLIKDGTGDFDNFGGFVEDGTRYFVCLLVWFDDFTGYFVFFFTDIDDGFGDFDDTFLGLVDGLGDFDFNCREEGLEREGDNEMTENKQWSENMRREEFDVDRVGRRKEYVSLIV